MQSLNAFGDDSSDGTASRVFSLACIVATNEQWKALDEAWLDRTGGMPFHATDCESNRRAYRHKSDLENKALYKDLTILLARSGAHGWGVAVDLAGHREFFPDVNEELSYHFCLIRILDFFSGYAQQQSAEQIRIALDNRIDVKFNASRLYSLMRTDVTQPNRDRLAHQLAFLSATDNPRIQMADLYARDCMKFLDNTVGPVRRPGRKSWLALTETGKFGGDFYVREYFADKKNRFADIEKKAGMNQQMYAEWLLECGLKDNVSNMFSFLNYLDVRDKRA